MKLTELLDQIQRLDKEATKGPWENIGRTIESNGTYEDVITTEVDCSTYCYGGRGGGVLKDKDAEFIALSRTALPQLAKVIEGLIEHCHNVMSWETPRGHEERIAVESRKQGARAVYKAITDAMEAAKP